MAHRGRDDVQRTEGPAKRPLRSCLKRRSRAQPVYMPECMDVLRKIALHVCSIRFEGLMDQENEEDRDAWFGTWEGSTQHDCSLPTCHSPATLKLVCKTWRDALANDSNSEGLQINNRLWFDFLGLGLSKHAIPVNDAISLLRKIQCLNLGADQRSRGSDGWPYWYTLHTAEIESSNHSLILVETHTGWEAFCDFDPGWDPEDYFLFNNCSLAVSSERVDTQQQDDQSARFLPVFACDVSESIGYQDAPDVHTANVKVLKRALGITGTTTLSDPQIFALVVFAVCRTFGGEGWDSICVDVLRTCSDHRKEAEKLSADYERRKVAGAMHLVQGEFDERYGDDGRFVGGVYLDGTIPMKYMRGRGELSRQKEVVDTLWSKMKARRGGGGRISDGASSIEDEGENSRPVLRLEMSDDDSRAGSEEEDGRRSDEDGFEDEDDEEQDDVNEDSEDKEEGGDADEDEDEDEDEEDGDEEDDSDVDEGGG